MPVENNSIDLVTIAQAIHWVNREKFYGECSRILKRNGVLALIGYAIPFLSSDNVDESKLEDIKYLGRKIYKSPLLDWNKEERRLGKFLQMFLKTMYDKTFFF